MREHEYRMVKGRVRSPPADPRIFFVPRAGIAAEHVAAHYRRANVGERLLDYRRALVDVATFEAVHFAPRFERKYPLVEAHASNPEWIVQALTGPGHESIECHRDVESKPGHPTSPP